MSDFRWFLKETHFQTNFAHLNILKNSDRITCYFEFFSTLFLAELLPHSHEKKWKFRKNYRPISIHHTCPGGIYWLLLLIFKFCHRVNMSCMYKRLALLHILVYFLITYIRRNRLYPTKALGVTSSIWFCSKRLKEKNGKSLFLKVRLCTYLLFAGSRVKLLPENSVIIIISAPSIIHKVKSSWSY